MTRLEAAVKIADAAATRIELSEGIVRGRDPRFPASYQSCSGYAQQID